VSEDIRGAKAAVLHVNVAWLLVLFVMLIEVAERRIRPDNNWTLQQMLRLVAETINAYKTVIKVFTNLKA
jgi:hypothetical protein